jgi:xanthine/CO dehydrogenase XdhC/CoxF family maturation factor
VSELKALLDALAAHASYERAVMITLVSLDGSGYRKPGARMLVADDGWSIGSVSGGCIENMLREHAARVMTGDAAEVIEIDTTSADDVLFGSGLGCPGKLRFRFEPFAREDFDARFGALRQALRERKEAMLDGDVIEPPIALHIFGSGNDVVPMVALAAAMQWETTAHGKDEAPGELKLDARSAAVLMSHNYFADLDWLRCVLRTDAGYIAIVGSRNRMEMIRGVLRDEGEPEWSLSRLRGPAGLDIGSETPAEIALAVLAEVKAVLAGRDGTPLTERARNTVARA